MRILSIVLLYWKLPEEQKIMLICTGCPRRKGQYSGRS
jgi:hypothetical protein